MVEMDTLLLNCTQCRHGLAMRILSVHPTVKCIICDKMKERSVWSEIADFLPMGYSLVAPHIILLHYCYYYH